ncbi:MAG: 4Fe-4S single cluster domain-containing protein [Clostridia bacterium]|nr:4Fe-4S single cluster domain-containing protein [Clostridia bacterium]
MRLAGLIGESVVDGPGVRLVVFAQGCPHHCAGCHNPGTWDFRGGDDVSLDDILESLTANPMLSGITISGGEPFAQARAFEILASLVRRVLPINAAQCGSRDYGVASAVASAAASAVASTVASTEAPVVVYTGYTWEALSAIDDADVSGLLLATDILIDGPYVEALRDPGLAWRGSCNQRILDAQASMRTGRPVLWRPRSHGAPTPPPACSGRPRLGQRPPSC